KALTAEPPPASGARTPPWPRRFPSTRRIPTGARRTPPNQLRRACPCSTLLQLHRDRPGNGWRPRAWLLRITGAHPDAQDFRGYIRAERTEAMVVAGARPISENARGVDRGRHVEARRQGGHHGDRMSPAGGDIRARWVLGAEPRQGRWEGRIPRR